MHDGRVKVMVALGGNFLAAAPDSAFTEAAVQNCELTVQMSTKLNRSHVVTGKTALMLPVLGRTEIDRQAGAQQFVTVENSMGMVTMSRGNLPPASEQLRSEVQVVAELAEATLGTTISWRDYASNYELIRDDIAQVIPGFEEFNDRLIDEGQLELPHAVRDERRFVTPDEKAQFTVHPIEPLAVPEGCYLMMTIRSHDQFNTTVYSQNDRYRGISESRRIVFMHPVDIAEAGLREGQSVTITSHYGDEERTMTAFKIVPFAIPLGCVATYYPETNPLIPVQHVADGSNTPAYKSVVVSLS
jgi:molybdopterin-dependent oxidoreductase alpha subunit